MLSKMIESTVESLRFLSKIWKFFTVLQLALLAVYLFYVMGGAFSLFSTRIQLACVAIIRNPHISTA
jgi:hypothetical protein